jgi:AcrR family transcriptional regulator
MRVFMDQRVPKKLLEVERRTPRQARAREMLASILEATADLVEENGLDAVNTNVIAERAGVSVGAVYQYFPNKAAILTMLGRREMETVREAARTALAAPAVWPAPPPDRAAVRALVRAFDRWLTLRRSLARAVLGQIETEDLAAPVEEIVLAIARGDDEEANPAVAPTALQMFVATRAITGVLRAAVLEDQAFLRDPAFEEALLALTRNYLRPN